MLPLAGIKVIDMAQVYMGPGAAMYLADQGAEVIKVEPLAGDTMRWRYTTPRLKERSLSKPFLALNRNKRSIALDVRTAEGQEIVHRLVAWADVFILNFRQGAEGPVRLDYETLADLNARLIYASITAFGREGPEASLPGYDIVIQARSGVLSTRRNSDGTPVPSAIMIADMSGAMGLSYAIMLALWERERTGRGQRVDMSLLQASLAMQAQQMVWVEDDRSPLPGQQPSALYSCYPCADGQWINIVVLEEHQWRALCRVLELEHLGDDARFASYELRDQQAQDLFEILDASFRMRSLDDWLTRLKPAGVPCAAVVERDEVPGDPQAVANRMFLEQDHPAVGKVRLVAPPFHLSETRHEPRLRRPAPLLGEHTAELLRQFGYADGAIEDLYRRRIVK